MLIILHVLNVDTKLIDMPVLKQEEYKGYIIQIMDTWEVDGNWYKILVNQPKWMTLRRQALKTDDPDELIDKAKAYIDEYEDRLVTKIKNMLKSKGKQRSRSMDINSPNLPDGDEWSDYAATESDY